MCWYCCLVLALRLNEGRVCLQQRLRWEPDCERETQQTTAAVNGAASTSMKRRYSRASPLKSLQTIANEGRLHTRVASAAALRGGLQNSPLSLSSRARLRQSPSIKLLSSPPSSSTILTSCNF